MQSQAQDPGLLTPTLTPSTLLLASGSSDPGQGPLRGGLALPSSRVSGCWQGQLPAVMKKASQPEADPGHTLSLRRLGSAGVCTLEARGTRPVSCTPASLYRLVKRFLPSIWNLEFRYSASEA